MSGYFDEPLLQACRRIPFIWEVGMLRDSQRQNFLQRFFGGERAPAYVLVRPDNDRLCPDCSTSYAVRDRYCPGCHSAVPEWRFG
ncbi:MAG: hypothetical protein ACRDG3_01190 [Tepidiformaceae bacterium]